MEKPFQDPHPELHCRYCGVRAPERFSPANRVGRISSKCRDCGRAKRGGRKVMSEDERKESVRASLRKYRDKPETKEQRRNYGREYLVKNPEVKKRIRDAHLVRGYSRNHRLMNVYGMTQADYAVMFGQQEGRCAICGQTENSRSRSKRGKRRNLAVDHDHATDRVRGLLCHLCNVGVGNFGDNPERMVRAAEYIQRHSA